MENQFKVEGEVLAELFGYEYVPTKTDKKFLPADLVWGYCGHCEATYLKCPKCGNNSCNGGNGILGVDKQGHNHVRCDLCDAMWQVEQFLEKEGRVPSKEDFETAEIDEVLLDKLKKEWDKHRYEIVVSDQSPEVPRDSH